MSRSSFFQGLRSASLFLRSVFVSIDLMNDSQLEQATFRRASRSFTSFIVRWGQLASRGEREIVVVFVDSVSKSQQRRKMDFEMAIFMVSSSWF